MGIKIYKVVADTTFEGKFYKKGSEVQLTSDCKNVNFKIIKEVKEEEKKISKK